MSIRTVIVCETQVPFVRGGAELLVRQLVDQLRARGFETDRVSLPFKWYPKDEILAHAAAWRLLDLSESNSRPVDLVIGTKFPSYFARHPRKVCWLVHQHRAAYELAGTIYSDFGHDERDVGLKERLMALDEQMLGECVGRYTISRTVTDRLRRFNGLDSTPLYHPPLLASRLAPGEYGPYVLSVSRLEGNKRVDLIVRAGARARAALAGGGRRGQPPLADRARRGGGRRHDACACWAR
jgi:glycosyltransferase involved in cell wall biosynthesis